MRCRSLSLVLCCLTAVAFAGCGDDGGGGPTDAETDAPIIPIDGDVDSGGPEEDAGPEDGGIDSGPSDDCLGIGDSCTSGERCRSGDCLPESTGTLGGPMDPIQNWDGGAISQTFFPGGYCTTSRPSMANPRPCEPGAGGDGGVGDCGPCGTCINAGGGATICVRACEPEADSNPCRDGYQCHLRALACLGGCTNDDTCRIYRADTNGDGEITTYNPDTDEGDHLVYDTESDATCDDTTNRCVHSGTDGVTAGEACSKDSQCEANGACLTEPGFGFPGGYCTKFGCDVPGMDTPGDVEGRTCAGSGMSPGDSACVPLGGDITACLTLCGSPSDCRPGYGCLSMGDPSPSMPGICFLGCEDDSDCQGDESCISPEGEDGTRCVAPMPDGGMPDGGMPDGGMPDSGVMDGGTMDADVAGDGGS